MDRHDMTEKVLRLCENGHGRDGWGQPITRETIEKWIRSMARGTATDEDVAAVVEAVLAAPRAGTERRGCRVCGSRTLPLVEDWTCISCWSRRGDKGAS